MSLAADKDLTTPAARLALAAPREWDEFMKGVMAHADTRRHELVNASLEEMPRAQGRAQEAALLAGFFRDAIAAANGFANRPKQKP
jgi:hypothetical protein